MVRRGEARHRSREKNQSLQFCCTYSSLSRMQDAMQGHLGKPHGCSWDKEGETMGKCLYCGFWGKDRWSRANKFKWGTLMISAGSGVQELTLDVYCLALGHLEWPTVWEPDRGVVEGVGLISCSGPQNWVKIVFLKTLVCHGIIVNSYKQLWFRVRDQ